MKRLVLAILAASALGLVTEARAASFMGSLWENTTLDATLANVPSGTPDVTFTGNNINFDSRLWDISFINPSYSIGAWLATGGAGILTGAGSANHTMNNTFVKITGWVSVTTGESFAVEHDDGITLLIGGLTVISSAPPTSDVTSTGTYTGTGGVVPFTLVYSEVAGPPAVLEAQLPLADEPPRVPDGGTTVALLGMALAGLAGLSRRVRAS